MASDMSMSDIEPPVDLSVPHDFESHPGLQIGELYCRRCRQVLKAGRDTITACWSLPVAPASPMRDALEAVLLFHSASPWLNAKVRRWTALVGNREATTKELCELVRRALTEHARAATAIPASDGGVSRVVAMLRSKGCLEAVQRGICKGSGHNPNEQWPIVHAAIEAHEPAWTTFDCEAHGAINAIATYLEEHARPAPSNLQRNLAGSSPEPSERFISGADAIAATCPREDEAWARETLAAADIIRERLCAAIQNNPPAQSDDTPTRDELIEALADVLAPMEKWAGTILLNRARSVLARTRNFQ